MDEPLVPLSVLSLDLDQPAGADWPTYLRGRGIEVTFDDIGRPAVSREVARRLLTERRESEARAAAQLLMLAHCLVTATASSSIRIPVRQSDGVDRTTSGAARRRDCQK